MANTYTLIASSTVGSGGAANIEFTSIPATYTDLLIKMSARAATGGDTFAYFPNYANTSYNKSFSVDDVSENNATNAYATLSANLYGSNSAITSIKIESINAANFVQYSNAYLYGISNS